jgi:hypothetical protein
LAGCFHISLFDIPINYSISDQEGIQNQDICEPSSSRQAPATSTKAGILHAYFIDLAEAVGTIPPGKQYTAQGKRQALQSMVKGAMIHEKETS